jgi:hypothetical protein
MGTTCCLSVIWQARYRFATCGVERENVKVVGFVGSEISSFCYNRSLSGP